MSDIDPRLTELAANQRALRDAMLALFYLRAKHDAEAGEVPPTLTRRIQDLSDALLRSAAAMNRLRNQRLLDDATNRSDEALAEAEVATLLIGA
jgi:hypothetical protein